MWHVYIVECADKTLYTGITTDLERRMEEHNSSLQGAKYTSGRRPVKLIYSCEMEDRSSASKEEYRIKNLSREEKGKLLSKSDFMSKFSWKNLKRPIVALAPMAGYTDSAYRQLVKTVAPNVLCFTEFTSVDALKYGSEKAHERIGFREEEGRPIIGQIFGSRPEHFVEAAQLVEQAGVDAIDINMGCPAKNIVSSDCGSALLNKPELAYEIVKQTVKATSLEVSVKTRIGVSNLNIEEFIQFCKTVESFGAKALTIHGRTTKQMYTGEADWEPIYRVKESVGIPVIGNGDILSAQDAVDKIKNLDGVMVGRGTFGNPWLMAEVYAVLHDETYSPPQTFEEKLPTYKLHCQLLVETKGEKTASLHMRKHLSSIIKGFAGASALRQQAVRVESLKEAFAVLDEANKAAMGTLFRGV
ncbi:MAG: tRNA dihydrouridine synthase DusB [Candidatus Peregrinibacteria bacterium]|nr:tRNA dihydrouridine synthase DusB [Candidatus Peregrinibacteria bacterium]